VQFHIEPSAADLRAWGRSEGLEPVGRLGPVLDQAEEAMGAVWRHFVTRFVHFAAVGDRADGPLLHQRLPLHGE